MQHNLDILNELFTEKDFAFLKNSNSYDANIDSQLKFANEKRDKLVEYINKFSNMINNYVDIDSTKASLSINSAEKAFKNINTIIINLSNLQDNLQNIEQYILELIIKKEKNPNINLDFDITHLQEQINIFDNYSKKISLENSSFLVDVNVFFDNYYNINLHNFKKENDSLNIDNFTDDVNKLQDNLVLKISEKENKVYLPYTKTEILEYLKAFPHVYKTCESVIKRDYILDLNFYSKHPVLARFRETYSLIRDREMKPAVDAFKRSVNLMFKYELNPAIIAGLKNEDQLDLYIECIEQNSLSNFKPFKIIFEVNPMVDYKHNNFNFQ